MVVLCRSYINYACYPQQPSGVAGFGSRAGVRAGGGLLRSPPKQSLNLVVQPGGGRGE